MNAITGKYESGSYALYQDGETLTVKAHGVWTRRSAAVLDGQISRDIAGKNYRHVDYDLSLIHI